MSSKVGQQKSEVKNKRIVMEPPDGGWGYMICVAAVINLIATTMFMGSFGIIFKKFFIDHEMGSTSITMMNGITTIFFSVSAFLTSPLIKLLNLRKVLFLGATLYNIGVFGIVFANSKATFFICQGSQFFGSGILYNLTCTLTNDYFIKKRLLATSITQTMSAVGAIFAPLLVEWAEEFYGYRGTLMVISGISLQTFVAVTLMEPVERHLVRVEMEKKTEEITLLLNEKPHLDKVINTPVVKVTDTDYPGDTKLDINGTELAKKQNFLQSLLDTTILKSFLLSNASMGPTYCCFAEMYFGLMLPMFLYSSGWKEDKVAQAISLGAFGDLVTRFLFIFTSNWLTKIGNQEVYIAATALAFIARLLMLWSENTLAIMVFITLMGVARSGIYILPPILLADIFPGEKFSSAFGIYMVLSGLMTLILGPAIGAITDMTSYSTAFYVMTSCYAAVLLLWSVELLYKRSKHKRVLQKEAAEKMKNLKNNKGKYSIKSSL